MTWEDLLKETAMRLFVQYQHMSPEAAVRDARKLVNAVKKEVEKEEDNG